MRNLNLTIYYVYIQTRDRIQHIERLGFKVYYIWVSDFKIKDRQVNPNVSFKDYMNRPFKVLE